MHKSALLIMLSPPPTVETRQITQFPLTTPTQTRTVLRADLATAEATGLCPCIEQRQSNGSYFTLLLQSYKLPKHHLKKKNLNNEGNLTPVTSRTYDLIAPSTAVNNILGYSTRNRKFKACKFFFNFQGRVPPRRRARKLLPLCHTHGSAPRSPYLPCQVMDQRKKSELEQNYVVPSCILPSCILEEKIPGRGASRCRLHRRFGENKFFR